MEKFLRNLVKFTAKIYYNAVFTKKKEFKYIPASGKLLDIKELENMIDASLDMWLTSGRFNDKFETEFAKYLGVKHALTTNSGSSANLLALSALTSSKLGDRRLKQGDEVIAVAAGFPTTVNPIIQNGLVPVFVDCEIGTYNIDVSKIEQAVTDRTKAVFIAHTLGNMFEIDKIKDIDNLEVQDGDDIYIPRTSNHVSIIGEVYNEQSFVYKKGANAKYYIKEVGGYTPNANKFRLYKVSVNGRAEKIGNCSSIEPGDTIVVPRKIAGNDWITPICDTLKGVASIIVMAFAINKW